MKERESDLPEGQWFKRKVLGVATGQVRDTLRFLSEHEEITIENQRGHLFQLTPSKLARKHMVVVYDDPALIWSATHNGVTPFLSARSTYASFPISVSGARRPSGHEVQGAVEGSWMFRGDSGG